MSRSDSTRGSKTVTIGELYLQLKSADLAGLPLDTAVASEFDVSIDYTYAPGLPASVHGAMEDGDPGVDEELSIKAIKTSANVIFGGDAGDVTIKRGTDILVLFTGAQVAALEDQVLAMIQKGGGDDF